MQVFLEYKAGNKGTRSSPREAGIARSLLKKTLVVTCAYNEAGALPSLLASLRWRNVLGLAIVKALLEAPRRVVRALRALTEECYSRLMAWRDAGRPLVREKYKRGVTTFEKNHITD